MLPRAHRLVKPTDFNAAVRRGGRCATPRLVVHCRAGESCEFAPLVGFVVPKKALAKAVDRNRVKRRLRHLMRQRIGSLPNGMAVVIRVLAPARTADSIELGNDLDYCLPKAVKRAQLRVLRAAS